MNKNNINKLQKNTNKQQTLVVREEQIRKRKQNNPLGSWEITKVRNMYAPVIRRFDGWSPCGKLLNEA